MIVVVGNGKSRAVLNLSLLDNHITYGCDALHRDYSPTHLVCGDPLLIWEILKKDYSLSHQCYFMTFDIIDAMHYEMLVGMSGSKVFEYPEQRTDKFVMYGQGNETAIYWVRTEEKIITLDWWEETEEENSYASDTATLKLASLHNPTENIYCVGFDYYLDKTPNNIYLGPHNHVSSSSDLQPDRKRWLQQIERIESEHQGNIYHVGKHLNYYEFEGLLNS